MCNTIEAVLFLYVFIHVWKTSQCSGKNACSNSFNQHCRTDAILITYPAFNLSSYWDPNWAWYNWGYFNSERDFCLTFKLSLYSLGCGNSSDKPYDVFTSPNYPNVYDINSECTYNISLPTNGSITITFETFELDRSEYDYVKASVNVSYLIFSLPQTYCYMQT